MNVQSLHKQTPFNKASWYKLICMADCLIDLDALCVIIYDNEKNIQDVMLFFNKLSFIASYQLFINLTQIIWLVLSQVLWMSSANDAIVCAIEHLWSHSHLFGRLKYTKQYSMPDNTRLPTRENVRNDNADYKWV